MSDTPPVKIPQPGAWLTTNWIAAAGYLVVGLVIVWPAPLHLFTHLQGDTFGDPLLNAWILGWDADRLRHGLQGLWQAPLFYPAPDTLAWSEHLLGIAVFTAPIYWLSENIVVTYNVAIIGSVVLAGMGVHLLAGELTGRRDAAWVAGLIFACLPYRVAQVGHLQMLYAGWMPLALLGLHRYFRTGSWRPLAGFVAAYVLTALSNGYYFFFLAVPVVIIAGWRLARQVYTRDHAAKTAGHLALAALAIVVALAPIIIPYLRVRQAQGFHRTVGEMAHYSATPAAYGSIAHTLRLWKGWLPVGKPEAALFPGLTLAVLAAIGLGAGWRRQEVQLYAAVALTAFLLTFGPRPDLGFGRLPTGPYDWLLSAPGLNGLRVPARFAMVVYLGLAILAAFGAAWVLERVRPRIAIALLVLASITAVGEGLSSLGVAPFPTPGMRDERAAYEWLRSQRHGPMLELPVGRTREGVRYLTGTLVHGNRIVNGYSGYGWALQSLFGGPPSGELNYAGELLRAARAVGLRYLLVHRHLYGDKVFGAKLARALADDREQVDRVQEFGATSVLILRPASAPLTRVIDPPITLNGCGFEASDNAGAVRRATDGDVGSRWLTGRPQRGTEWFVVRCPSTLVLTGIELLVDRRSYSDYPRRLAIDVSSDGVSFEPLWEGGVLAELAVSVARSDRPTAIQISLPPAPFRAVRLRQTGQTPRQVFWSIDELQLRGR
jgi:hypothetical protein